MQLVEQSRQQAVGDRHLDQFGSVAWSGLGLYPRRALLQTTYPLHEEHE